jgi:lipoprotein-anchoring transpeptidase ErfK/SrfK
MMLLQLTARRNGPGMGPADVFDDRCSSKCAWFSWTFVADIKAEQPRTATWEEARCMPGVQQDAPQPDKISFVSEQNGMEK